MHIALCNMHIAQASILWPTYSLGDQAPMYDLIIGKQKMHNLGVKFDFQEKTITIDKINPLNHEENR